MSLSEKIRYMKSVNEMNTGRLWIAVFFFSVADRNSPNFKEGENAERKSETICFQEHFGSEWCESSRGVYRRDARPAICLWVTASQGDA